MNKNELNRLVTWRVSEPGWTHALPVCAVPSVREGRGRVSGRAISPGTPNFRLGLPVSCRDATCAGSRGGRQQMAFYS